MNWKLILALSLIGVMTGMIAGWFAMIAARIMRKAPLPQRRSRNDSADSLA